MKIFMYLIAGISFMGVCSGRGDDLISINSEDNKYVVVDPAEKAISRDTIEDVLYSSETYQNAQQDTKLILDEQVIDQYWKFIGRNQFPHSFRRSSEKRKIALFKVVSFGLYQLTDSYKHRKAWLGYLKELTSTYHMRLKNNISSKRLHKEIAVRLNNKVQHVEVVTQWINNYEKLQSTTSSHLQNRLALMLFNYEAQYDPLSEQYQPPIVDGGWFRGPNTTQNLYNSSYNHVSPRQMTKK